MNRIHILIFSFFFVSSLCLHAQILPPNITCITNDSIFYEPVANPCGPFISYEVFTSNNVNGPYTILETITDETATFTEHPNSSNQLIYYYIVPNFDCPGEALILSDTVTNRPPEAAMLQTVSVENDELILTWRPSPSPEVVLYSVFLLTNTGLEFLADTPNTSFTDIIRDPNVSVHEYLIVAIDACDNRSIFGDPVSSVFLTTTIVPCVNEIQFDWNQHIRADLQELWATATDGTETLIQSLDTDTDNFTLTDIPNIDIANFFIRGYIDGDLSKIANSNITPVSNEVTVMMDEILFTRISTQNENIIDLEWCWNRDADLNSFEVQFTSSSVSNTNEEAVNGTLNVSENAQININNTADEVSTISVITVDECDRIFNSEEIQTTLLTVAPLSEGQLDIRWSDYNYLDAMFSQYELHEVIDGIDNIIYEGRNSQLVHPPPGNTRESCYYVISTAEGTLLDGSNKETVIVSNTACSKGFPIIRMPNAFNPYGLNSIFRPAVGNTDAIVSYQMNIFSRYGEVLFSSDTYTEGWNGRSGLREMPQGVYTYLVEVEVLGGENITLQGSLMLIR